MPPVIAGAAIGFATGGIGITAAGALTFSLKMALIGAALGAASGAVSMAMAPDAPKPGQRDHSITLRSGVAPRAIIYGQRRVGGVLVYAESTEIPADTGSDARNWLYLCIALAGHEVEEIGDIYFDDQIVSLEAVGSLWVPTEGDDYYDSDPLPGPMGTAGTVDRDRFVRIAKHLGTNSQSADDTLLSMPGGQWTSAHRLLGTAYIAARLMWDAEKFANGYPEISAVVKGRKVYDPRTGTTAWSANPALCIRDYLVSDFGLACDSEEIDEASFIAAANICDEEVTLAGGSEQARYRLNGVIVLDERPIEILEAMLTACAGAIVYSQGKYVLYAGAYRAPTIDLTADDLRDEIQVRARPPKSELFNRVRGTFCNPAEDWELTEFPSVGNPTYETQDGGERIERDIELPYTTDPIMAQRIAKIHLERSRQGITVDFPAKITALQVAVMEPVRLTISRFGWTNKVFIPTGWKLSAEGVDLVLQEEASSVYDWNSGHATTRDPAPDTALPNPFRASSPGLALGDDLIESAGQVVTRLLATLTPPAGFIVRYEVEYRKAGATSWIGAGTGAATDIAIVGVTDDTDYEVRARAINAAGVPSAWVTRTRQIVGQSAPPAPVVGFTVNIIDHTAFLSWEPVTDLDLSHYRVRFSPDPAETDWGNAVDFVPRVGKPATSVQVPARVGTYFIKAVDYRGFESVTPAISVSTIAGVQGLNVVTTQSEHPTWSGTLTDCFVDSGALRLTGGTLIDSLTGNWDDLTGNVDALGGIVAEGSYAFDGPDLGGVYTSRVTASLKVTADDVAALWDDIAGNVDDIPGLIDGETPSQVNVRLQISTTEDDPAGAPTWSAYRDFIVGDYKARAFRFKAILESRSASATPVLEELTVTVDMPDRVAADRNLTSNAAGSAITFSPAFKVTPAIGITGNNLATGDYYSVTSASATGFTVRFFNAAGAGIARNFDWFAKGYGRSS
jgi:hypothetical protein